MAHFVELEKHDGTKIAVAVFDQPIVAQFPRREEGSCWKTSQIDAYPDDRKFDGFISCTWLPDCPEGSIAHLDSFWRIFHVRQFNRFHRAPSTKLDLETLRSLKAGDSVGEWVDESDSLKLGFDAVLASIGFEAVGPEGYNCVTDYGRRYSIPLRCPTAKEWESQPLSPPLASISGLRDTPPHSWRDEVMSFVGKTLRGIELGPRSMAAEGTSHVKIRGRSGDYDSLPAQPCYEGEHLWQVRIGRYKIFAVQLTEGIVYLTDSNWRDKETAILFFAKFRDAVEYCRGNRPSPPAWFGKRDHDHDGNWKSDLFSKIVLTAQRQEVTLEQIPEDPLAKVEV